MNRFTAHPTFKDVGSGPFVSRAGASFPNSGSEGSARASGQDSTKASVRAVRMDIALFRFTSTLSFHSLLALLVVVY